LVLATIIQLKGVRLHLYVFVNVPNSVQTDDQGQRDGDDDGGTEDDDVDLEQAVGMTKSKSVPQAHAAASSTYC
jgi:hypothetical protein